MRRSKEALFEADAIAARVREMGETISADLKNDDVVVVAVLKGALHFCSDLVRTMSIPIAVDFIRPKSYSGTRSTNRVDILTAPTEVLNNRTVLVVEDVLDTGRTTSVVLDWIAQKRPAKVRLATLLEKTGNRRFEIRPDYVGFHCPDTFVIGYGLDHDEKFRELPAIYTLNGEDG